MSDKLWPLAVITFVAVGYYNASTEISYNFKLLPAFVVYWITYWSLGFYYLYMDSLQAGDYHDQYQNSAFRGPRLTADEYKSGLSKVYKELCIAMTLAFSASFMLDQISAPFPYLIITQSYHG